MDGEGKAKDRGEMGAGGANKRKFRLQSKKKYPPASPEID